MNTRPPTKAFLDLIAKNGPMPRQVALLTLANLIPPGQALRVFARRHKRATTRTADYEDQIANGQRYMALQSLYALTKRGTLIESDGMISLPASER